MMKLLSESRSNTKLRKSETSQYRIVSLALDPGAPAICPHATAGCRAVCVGGESSGMAAVFPSIQEGRRRKTEWYMKDRKGFYEHLRREILSELRIAEYNNESLVCRLNTFSDLDWSEFVGTLPDSIIYYDYSKMTHRFLRIQKGDWPKNYHITFSWSENPRTQEACARILSAGGNVAVCFCQDDGGRYCGHGAYRQKLPGFWDVGGNRHPVFDGDESDLRFLDVSASSWNTPRPGSGWICGLRLKASTQHARRVAIDTGFAVVYQP